MDLNPPPENFFAFSPIYAIITVSKKSTTNNAFYKRDKNNEEI